MENGIELKEDNATAIIAILVQELQASDKKSREKSLAITKLQEALFWLRAEE